MTAGRLGAVAALIAFVVAGCGSAPARRTPDPAGLPLVAGTRVVASARHCDTGSNAFCVIEMVAVNPRFSTASKLLAAQSDQLRSLGWTPAGPEIGEERAAESPGHRLWASLATAYGDLKGVDLGWITRSRSIALALSKAMFERAPAISIKLQAGSS
jgi:hypothetical protein